MNKKRFQSIAAIVVVVLAVCAIGMVINTDHIHFMKVMKVIVGK